ncbi:hypothetical protein GCM10009095_13630 [Sphingomonas molluscorum]|nr:hypothetical protein GCM10017606_05900 [Microbacterium terregens]
MPVLPESDGEKLIGFLPQQKRQGLGPAEPVPRKRGGTGTLAISA